MTSAANSSAKASTEQRYGHVAVIFHWLIALFIIGLLIIGKFMTSLDENSPVRFVLTQWHKSFGLTVLALSVLRIIWRLTHRPPAEPSSIALWQQRSASVAHWLLYALMFAMPITGWIMVSASPLNIDTVLFDVITIPHLPPFTELANREAIAAAFHEYHELASHALIVLLLVHSGAALKHHFIDKDTTLLRMSPDTASHSFKRHIVGLVVIILGVAGGLFFYNNIDRHSALLAAGESEVSFIALVSGSETPGIFIDSVVTATIDTDTPSNSTIVAVVKTGTLTSDNAQVEGSLPDTDWFDSEGFPEARFESTDISANDDGTLAVVGSLTIKETTTQVSFPMSLSDEEGVQVARGEFVIDRKEYNIGMQSQSGDGTVGFDVTVKFRFDIGVDSAN